MLGGLRQPLQGSLQLFLEAKYKLIVEVAAHLAHLIRVVLHASQSVRAVVESSAHEFLFHVVPEGEDIGNLIDAHLVVGENKKSQLGVYWVAGILGKDFLQVLTIFLLEATFNCGHSDISF